MYLSALSLALTRPSGLSLSQLTAAIFTQYSASPSVWYDPSDLVWNWRRNLFVQSEFQTGVSGVGLITSTTMVGPDGSTVAAAAFGRDGTTTSYVYKATVLALTQYTVSAYVQMDDGNAPTFGSASAASPLNDFALVVGNQPGLATAYTVEHLGGALYRVSGVITSTASNLSNTGVLKYASNSARTFKTTAWQVEVGAAATPYQRITDGVQDYFTYGSALPTLYQDSAGTTPVTAVGQPVGLMLDKSRGLVLGSELVSNGGFDSDTVWTKGTNWAISGGQAVHTVGASGTLDQPLSDSVAGKAYRVTFDVVSITPGTGNIGVRLVGGTQVIGLTHTTTGTKTQIIFGNGTNTTLRFFASTADIAVTVDNISVRELPGAHLIQATALSRPTLQARVNLLTYSEQFDNAAWTKTLVNISANAAVAPDGTTTADKAIATAVAGNHIVFLSTTPTSGVGYTFSFYAKSSEYTKVGLRIGGAGYAAQPLAAINLATGAIISQQGLTSLTVTSVGSGWYRVVCAFTSGTGLTPNIHPLSDSYTIVSDNFTYTGDGTSGIFIWGADLRLSTFANLPYQQVTTATDYADIGAPRYLAFDGVDDGMVSAANFDMTSTDKVTVVAGVRKLSDAAGAILAELSVSTNANVGSFFVSAPNDTETQRYGAISRGAAAVNAAQGSYVTGAGTAPDSAVLTAVMNISGDSTVIRRNGTAFAAGTSDQGTGNYGSYPLYIGRRGGTTLPFNGRFYGLSIIGAQLSASDITVLERFTASKTGITI